MIILFCFILATVIGLAAFATRVSKAALLQPQHNSRFEVSEALSLCLVVKRSALRRVRNARRLSLPREQARLITGSKVHALAPGLSDIRTDEGTSNPYPVR